MQMITSKTLTFFTPKTSSGNGAILVDVGISAGFHHLRTTLEKQEFL